jgi:uncharacterized protein (TIGR02145 family)
VWTPEPGYEEFATVIVVPDDPNACVITGKQVGSFNLNVISYDATGSTNLTVQIQADPVYGSITGLNGTYRTFTYPNDIGTWMIDNSKEVEYYYDAYPSHESGERGYYYHLSQAASACPQGFRLPSTADCQALTAWYYEEDQTVGRFGELRWPSTVFAGELNRSTWKGWDVGIGFYVDPDLVLSFHAEDSYWKFDSLWQVQSDVYGYSVRCIKIEE